MLYAYIFHVTYVRVSSTARHRLGQALGRRQQVLKPALRLCHSTIVFTEVILVSWLTDGYTGIPLILGRGGIIQRAEADCTTDLRKYFGVRFVSNRCRASHNNKEADISSCLRSTYILRRRWPKR